MALCLPGVAGGFDYGVGTVAAPPLQTSSILPPVAGGALPQLAVSDQQRQDGYGGNILSRLRGGLQEQLRARGEQLLTPDGLAATLDQGRQRRLSDTVADLGVQLTQSAIDGGLSQVEDKLLGNFVRSINLSFSPSLAGRETILQADSILSLYDSDQYALIGQAGLQSRGGDAAGNLGLAWRYRAVDNWMLGVNTFYDYLADPRVDRWSFGVEAKSHFVGVSANIYRGIGEERNGTIEHYSPDGWDMELAGHLEQLPWLEYSARYYNWDLLDGGDLNGSDYKLTVRPMPLLGIALRYDSPGGGDSEFGFETTFEYRFDSTFGQQKLFSNVATVGDVWQRRFERVRREYEQRVQTRSLGPSSRQLGACFSTSCSISFGSVPSGTDNLLLTASRRTGGAGLVRAVAPTSASPLGSGGVARNHSGNCHVESVAAVCSYDGTSQTVTIMDIPAGSYSLVVGFRNAANDVLGSTTVQLEITLPTLSISGSTTVTEANDFSLSFISDGPLASALTITMTVSGGTAEVGDYVLPAAAITLPVVAGASNVPFTIEVNEDPDLDNETIELTFTLSGDAMGVAAPAPITLSITDDDSAMLSSLAVSSGVLVPAFAPDTTSYTLMVASDVRSVSLTPTAADTDAMGITINGNLVDSGSASNSITLPAGMTTQIQIVLTAEDGTTMLTYTIQAMAAAGPVLSVAASDSSVAEGGSVTLTISSIGGAPSEAVTIDISAQAGSTASDSASGSIAADYSISAAQVTLGVDGTITPSSITIATVDDMVDEGAGETIMLAYNLTAGDSGASLATAAATITIQDNDAAGITVEPSNVDVSLGDSTPFNVVLNSQPLFAVALNMASAAPATATVSPASISFTSDNWNVPQAVTVNGVASGTTNIAFTISTDAQSRYSSAVAAPSVAVAVIAPPIITVTPTPSDSVTEGSAFTLQLAVSRAPGEQITMDVTVNTVASTAAVTSDYDMVASPVRVTIGADGSVSPSSIAISTVDDDSVEDRETIVLSYTVNAGGTGIVAPTDTTLYIDDEDSATLRVRDAPLAFNEAVGAATVTIELTRALLSELQVMVSSADGTAVAVGDYTELSQMVTFAIGDTSQMVSLTIENDNVAEDDETLQLILAPTTMPIGLNTVISPAIVTITDDDMRGIVSTGTSSFTVTEEASNTYTLALSSQPTGPVTIALTSADTGAATVSPATLSFSTGNWSVAQTVTVTGVDDDDSTNESTTITHAASGSDYDSVMAAQPVTVNDNDDPPDTTPPGPVTDLTATPGNDQVALSWTNPSDADLSTVIISATVTAGGAAVDLNGASTTGNDLSISATAGSTGSQTITTGLSNGIGYTFSLVASDGTNSSTPVTIAATPVAPLPEFSFETAGITVAEGFSATVN
ncbi:MAG: inverse autotransporter beta domain-containing protein, partial [Candidatus Porifericomitaceae bacterium WSBS_2022_MAG_OTU9]